MNKLIKIDAVIATLLLVVGSIFKHNHYPGANIMLGAGAAAGVLLFILLLWKMPGKQFTGLEIATVTLSSVALIFTFLAFAFKILHWPGAAKVVWIADIGIILSAVLFFIDMLQESEPLKLRLKAIAFFFILNLLFVLFYFAH
ncbi:MAG: hypothetical protein V2I47_05230 [Bacteroidales bacterium]|jgi:hypothetical protein|nr:hypothetical protein [Bacteroidales bacterium]